MHNTRINEGGELWTAARRAKVTMTDLAAFLGVSRPTVYKYLVYKPESMPVGRYMAAKDYIAERAAAL